MVLQMLPFWTFSLRKDERINFCCCKPPACGNVLRQPQAANTLGIYTPGSTTFHTVLIFPWAVCAPPVWTLYLFRRRKQSSETSWPLTFIKGP